MKLIDGSLPAPKDGPAVLRVGWDYAGAGWHVTSNGEWFDDGFEPSEALQAAFDAWIREGDDFIGSGNYLTLNEMPNLAEYAARGLELCRWLKTEVGDAYAVCYWDPHRAKVGLKNPVLVRSA